MINIMNCKKTEKLHKIWSVQSDTNGNYVKVMMITLKEICQLDTRFS